MLILHSTSRSSPRQWDCVVIKSVLPTIEQFQPKRCDASGSAVASASPRDEEIYAEEIELTEDDERALDQAWQELRESKLAVGVLRSCESL